MPLAEFESSYPNLIRRLRLVRAGDRVAHAYVFCGDNLETLHPMATAWVQACACRRSEAGDACGRCDDCRRIAADTYPYLDALRPKSRTRMIRIEDVRELANRLRLKSAGELHAGLIVGADRMTAGAQNAFLKTLEEPTPQTLLVLLTTAPAMLLPTIRSRCQTIALRDNHVNYAFDGFEELCAGIRRLRRGAGAWVACDVSAAIMGSLAAMKERAESVCTARLKELRQRFPDMETRQWKRLESEEKAATAATYLAARERVLSVIETWFSQEFIRACGGAVDDLPNTELYAHGARAANDAPPPREALANLRLVENLLRQLDFNVDETLTVIDFCQQVCAKV